MTEKQLMAFHGYHDPVAVDYEPVKAALLLGLQSRVHDKPAMAALNILEYKYNRNITSDEAGKKKEDSLSKASEIDGKIGDRFGKAFDSMNQALAIAVKPEQAAITVEPWKQDAWVLEKKLSAASAKVSRFVQTGQSLVLKLYRHTAEVKSTLAEAQRENLETNLGHFTKALNEYTAELSSVDCKTESRAKEQEEVAGTALSTLKIHITAFDKVLNLSKNYLSMFD